MRRSMAARTQGKGRGVSWGLYRQAVELFKRTHLQSLKREAATSSAGEEVKRGMTRGALSLPSTAYIQPLVAVNHGELSLTVM